MDSCIAFAESHGLMNEKEAERARTLRTRLDVGGPGGCKSPRDCEAYCSSLNNIEECIAFAEENGIEDEHINEGKKMLAHLRSGGTTPGGCNSKDKCEVYCSDVDHIEECIAFAEKVGFEKEFDEDFPEGVDPKVMMRKFAELVKSGESPGGCKSKDQCESYCRNESNVEECISFGRKMGFMNEKEEEMFRKTGGKGPGGCNSRESCETYCNDPSNQETCFRFAEEHGLIPPKELERAKTGMARLRAGTEQAPPEVAECLKSTLGQNIIEDIQAGRLAPGPQIGDRVRGCFEKFSHPEGFEGIFENAPPEVLECVSQKLGADTVAQLKAGEVIPGPEIGDTFRVCFESNRIERGEGQGPEKFSEFLRSAPPAVGQCVKEKLGSEFEEITKGEKPPSSDIEQTIRGCFESFRPAHEGMMGEMRERMDGNMEFERRHEGDFEGMRPQEGLGGAQAGIPQLPPEVLGCVNTALGEGGIERVLRGEASRENLEQAIRKCYEEIRNTLPSPLPSFDQPFPVSGQENRGEFFNQTQGGSFNELQGGTLCAQVITPAHNPETGECREFPTPCEVPSEWALGCSAREEFRESRKNMRVLLGSVIAPFQALLRNE